MCAPEETGATQRVWAFINSLDVEVEEAGPGQWGIVLDSGGYPLHVTVVIRGSLLRIQAAVLPAGLIDPHQLLYWNRQAPFVCFGEDLAGEVYLSGELPVEQLTTDTLDRCLGLLLASSTRAREFATSRN
jgi:hypothetical protein